MDRDTIRLECLKLWHRHDRDPAQVVMAAKQYEEYIVEESTQVEKQEVKKSQPKKTGNPDLFK